MRLNSVDNHIQRMDQKSQQKTKTAKKKGFLDGYKIYDPKTEGYGNPNDWRSAFFTRMGMDEALEVLGAIEPLKFFGLETSATWEDVEKVVRVFAKRWHPDVNDTPEAHKMMQDINAAYTVLKERFKK